MNRLPDSRRRVAGVSVIAILAVLAVLWLLRKVPSAERKGSQGVPAAVPDAGR